MTKFISPFTLTLLGIVFFQACLSPEQKQLKKIEQLEKELFGNVTTIPDREKSLTLVTAYVEYAEMHPGSEKAPEFIFRAADICMNTGYPGRAIELYTMVYRDYPEYAKRPESLFLIAFIYETQFNNLQLAEHNYKKFVEQFPDHDLADDAKILLQHLGKSPDELVKEFEERLKAQEDL